LLIESNEEREWFEFWMGWGVGGATETEGVIEGASALDRGASSDVRRYGGEWKGESIFGTVV